MLSENLESKDYLYLTTLIIVAGMWILNYLSPEISDDYIYKFVFDQNVKDGEFVNIDHPVSTINDIIISQYNHYFMWNGRTITHLIVQFFTGIAGKPIFNIINAFIFVLFIYFLLVYTGYRKTGLNLLFVTGIIFFLFPIFNQTVFWMTGAINYLWTCTFICLLLLGIKRTIIKSKPIDFLLIIPSILIGWTHEGLTVPMAGSLLIFSIFKWKEVKNTVALILISGFFMGALLCSLGPATINRASSDDYSIIQFIIIKSQSLFVVLWKLKAFFVFIICIIIDFILNKKKFWIFLKNFYINNLIECNALIFSFGIVFISGFWAVRSAIGVELFSIILILKILRKKIFNKKLIDSFKYAISLGLIILYAILLKYSLMNHDIHNNIMKQLENRDCNVIKYDNLQIGNWLGSFIVNHVLSTQINPSNVNNRLISRIYSHDYLIFIPQNVFRAITQYKGLNIPLDNQSEFPFYIFPVENGSDNNSKITFILRKTKEEEIPFYLKPFASKLQRYTALEIESPKNNNYIIQIEGKSYWIISKNSMIDNRVVDIKIN